MGWRAMDVKELYQLAIAKHAFYETAMAYADEGGTMVQTDPMLKKVLANRGGTMRFNFCARIIKAYTSRARLASVTADGADLGDLLDGFIKQANIHALDLAKYGDAYLMVWPYADDSTDSGVTIRSVDPLSTSVVYEDGQPVLGLRTWVTGSGSERRTRLDVYDAERLTRWQSKDLKNWEPYSDDTGDAEIPHDLGVVPIFHTTIGRPVHYEGYGTQDMILRLIIAHGAAIDFMGWPQIYALYEMNTSAGTAELGDTDYADQDAADIRDETKKLRRDPGSLWAMRAKQVGQLQAASSADFLASLRDYIDMMASLTGVPARYFLAPGGQHPSGDTLTTADSDFREAVSEMTAALADTFKGALEVAAGSTGMNVEAERLTVTWVPQEIQQGKAFWEVTGLKQDAGVPMSQTLLEAGYTMEQIEAFEQDSGKDMTMLRRVEIIDKLGDALGKLTALTATDVISPEKINTLITALISDADTE